MYDFAAREIRFMDLECYRRGPYRNEVGRLPGSTRFMAPRSSRVARSLTVGRPCSTWAACWRSAPTGMRFPVASRHSSLRRLLLIRPPGYRVPPTS